jgi:uncharacterized protein
MKAEHLVPRKRKLAREQALPVVPQIQVTRNCNFGCDYCFQEHSGGIIELSTVESILHRVITHNRRADPKARCIQVYWHGGEPLLAGIDFFREIIHLEKYYPEVLFENRIQTNATLMSDELARFFSNNRFQVGFSLDGPREIHDLHRRFRLSGGGTFDAAMQGIDRYRKHAGQERIAVIAVVTRAGVGRAREIFEFFKTLQAEVQLDIYDLRRQDVLQPVSGLSRPSDLPPSPEEIGQFLIDLFDLWFYEQEARLDFRELHQELKMILQPEIDRGDPFDKKRCDFRRLVFAPDGLAFSCDQWLNEEKTAIGDIRTDSLESILERKALLWEEIKRGVRKSGEAMGCGECEWGRQCGGGCMTCMKYNALLLQSRARGLPDSEWAEQRLPDEWSEIKGETYYCDGLRAFRRHVQEAVQREIMDAE